MRIGGYPELSIEQARKQASIINAEIAQGVDPQAARRAIRDETIFNGLFTSYLETYAKPHKRTWPEDQRMFNKYLKQWHARPISKISRADIASLHARVGKNNGQYQANRILGLLSALFNFAISRDWLKENPCKNIKKFKELTRDRFLDGIELKRFFLALANEKNTTWRDFFIVCLLSGARRGNVASMQWDHVDLVRGIWRISDAESKNKEPLICVLPLPVIDILKSRNESTNGSRFVFESKDNQTGHIVSPGRAWARILKSANIENLHIHDLRRTLGSWQAASGASLPIIGKSLGHKSQQATAIYARLDIDPVRNSVENAARAMLAAGDTKLLEGRE